MYNVCSKLKIEYWNLNYFLKGIKNANQRYNVFSGAIDYNGNISLDFRKHSASKALALTAEYDSAISSWFAVQLNNPLPAKFSLAGQRSEVLRYGENPHQQAAARGNACTRVYGGAEIRWAHRGTALSRWSVCAGRHAWGRTGRGGYHGQPSHDPHFATAHPGRPRRASGAGVSCSPGRSAHPP